MYMHVKFMNLRSRFPEFNPNYRQTNMSDKELNLKHFQIECVVFLLRIR